MHDRGLAIFMIGFSAITSAFEQVFEQAGDPEFKPLEQFRIIREKQKELVELYKDTGTTREVLVGRG